MHHETLLSSWIYWVICLFFFTLANKCDKNKRTFCETVCFIIIYLFAVMRYDFGNDFPTYWNQADTEINSRNYEPFSGAIIDYAAYLNFPPLLFIVFSTISLYGYRRLIRPYSSNPPLSWYMYFTFPLFFFQNCSTVREAGAMGFFYIAYSLLEEKKTLGALGCLVVSVLFHYSAIIGFIILLKPIIKKLNVKYSLLLIIGGYILGKAIKTIVLGYLGNTMFGAKFEYYLELESVGFNTLQYVLYAILVINLLFYNKLIKYNSQNKLYINLYTVGIFLYVAFSIEPTSAIRFSTFFLMFVILLVPGYKSILAERCSSKSMANGIIIISMFTLQLILINIYINAYNKGIMERPVYVPYKTWLNHI